MGTAVVSGPHARKAVVSGPKSTKVVASSPRPFRWSPEYMGSPHGLTTTSQKISWSPKCKNSAYGPKCTKTMGSAGFLRLTPCHPESSHCQESFRNPPAIHAVGAQGPRQTPEQQPRKSHLTTTQPKCPSMSDSAPQADTMPSGPTRSHTPPVAPCREQDDQRPPPTHGARHRLPAPRESLRLPPPVHTPP
jgi:hypothetical protein